MRRSPRWSEPRWAMAAVAGLLALALGGCDGLLVEPADAPDAATLSLTVAPAPNAVPGQALPDGNRLRVQVRTGSSVTLDTLFMVPAGTGVYEVVLSVPLTVTPATRRVEVELRENRLALLRGVSEVVLNRRRVTVAEIELFPADDPALAPVTSISAGIFHSCALKQDGRAVCWGDNLYGQLGDGGTRTRLTPAPVTGDLRFRDVAAAFAVSCGLDLDGRIHCWGESDRGALGAGDVRRSTEPVAVATDQRFAAMTIGGLHGCGRTEDGRAYCWGFNRYGQVGNGRSGNQENVPVPIAPQLRFRELSAGYLHTCGVTEDDRAYCWGYNEYGQVGTGTLSERVTVPTPLGAPGDAFVSIAAGGLHTCALTAGGAAYCWGYNAFGQLGHGPEAEAVADPRPVSGGSTFRGLSTGGGHTCGLLQDGGEARCWGYNRSGPLGTGATASSSAPVAVSGGIVVERIDAGLHHTCAINSAAESLCWGFNRFGQLGDRSTLSSPWPGYVNADATGPVELGSRTPEYPAALGPLFEGNP